MDKRGFYRIILFIVLVILVAVVVMVLALSNVFNSGNVQTSKVISGDVQPSPPSGIISSNEKCSPSTVGKKICTGGSSYVQCTDQGPCTWPSWMCFLWDRYEWVPGTCLGGVCVQRPDGGECIWDPDDLPVPGTVSCPGEHPLTLNGWGQTEIPCAGPGDTCDEQCQEEKDVAELNAEGIAIADCNDDVPSLLEWQCEECDVLGACFESPEITELCDVVVSYSQAFESGGNCVAFGTAYAEGEILLECVGMCEGDERDEPYIDG